jgi:hypothetical protein
MERDNASQRTVFLFTRAKAEPLHAEKNELVEASAFLRARIMILGESAQFGRPFPPAMA